MRHLFDTRDNDPHKALCKHFNEGDLIRMLITNVDCPHCIRLAKHPDFDKVDNEDDVIEMREVTPPVFGFLQPGFRPQAISELPDEGPEKLYLVCEPCGEAFDTIETAAAHEHTDENEGFGHEYTIKPESEAM